MLNKENTSVTMLKLQQNNILKNTCLCYGTTVFFDFLRSFMDYNNQLKNIQKQICISSRV